MYRFGRFLTLTAVAAVLGAPAYSQAPSTGASAGRSFIDWSPASKLPRWIQVGVQIRGRLEAPSGTSALNSGSDTYYLSRIRVDLAFKPLPWLKFFAQAQDARVGGYNITPAPATLYNPMDLRQGYIALDHEGSVNLALRAGRQELSFGGERLIGAADWGMSRTFDAVDVSAGQGRAKVDLFAGSPVLIDSNRFDRHKPGEHLYGAYGSIRRVLPGLDVEPYLLFKQTLLIKSESGVLGDGLVASPGLRLIGKTPWRVDYLVEALLQRGSFAVDRIHAMAQSYLLGWTILNSPLKPRISTEYNYASGDAANKDGTRGTFDQFYPSNHGYYGMIDQFGWKNLKNWRIGFDCIPAKKLKLRADFNEFYLATIQDSLYNSAGTSAVLNRSATSSHIGAGMNGVALYQWSTIWRFGAGYGHLFAGDYLKQSKAGFGYTYPYLLFVGSF